MFFKIGSLRFGAITLSCPPEVSVRVTALSCVSNHNPTPNPKGGR